MTKKTVPFKMPAKATPRAADERRKDLPPSEKTAAPISLQARREAAHAVPVEPDQWVQHRDGVVEADPMSIKLTTRPYAPAAPWSLTIDLSAERDLRDVMALALLVPPMLGWYWVFNVMNRYWSHIG
ncbi:hypothetical protein SAMN05444161_5631 [Rhizobiales bacterium GAS191]|nr:hypothetical protein SAMN05444161_5631 [Rhizobiales bacterium GAS191]